VSLSDFHGEKPLLQPKVLNQKTIKFAATQNDLGILVSNDLKWSSHVINIVAKAKADKFVLNFLSVYAPAQCGVARKGRTQTRKG
jgi:hypothetical protein